MPLPCWFFNSCSLTGTKSKPCHHTSCYYFVWFLIAPVKLFGMFSHIERKHIAVCHCSRTSAFYYLILFLSHVLLLGLSVLITFSSFWSFIWSGSTSYNKDKFKPSGWAEMKSTCSAFYFPSSFINKTDFIICLWNQILLLLVQWLLLSYNLLLVTCWTFMQKSQNQIWIQFHTFPPMLFMVHDLSANSLLHDKSKIQLSPFNEQSLRLMVIMACVQGAESSD